MVFEPEAAPREHAAFMAWYFELTKWNDGPYDDPRAEFTPTESVDYGDAAYLSGHELIESCGSSR